MTENIQLPHECTLSGREKLFLTGVSEVNSFNDALICLNTASGALTVSGERLFVDQLDLESGRVSITGRVNSLAYEDRPAEKHGSWLKRVFR